MKRIIVYTLLLMVTVLICVSSTSANKGGPNLVINGTMEKPSVDFVGLPHLWAYDAYSNVGQVFRVPDTVHQGDYSMAITTVDIGVGVIARAIHGWMYRPVTTPTDDLYTLGFWLYDASADPNTLSVQFVTQDEDTGSPIYREIGNITITGGMSGPWTYYEYAAIDPGVTYLQRMTLAFQLEDASYGGPESTVYIDDVSLRRQP